MNKTALALGLLIALPGIAFAGDRTGHEAHTPAACTATGAKVDCAATGSIEKPRPAPKADTATGGRKLGMDVDPWSIVNGM